MHIVSHVFCLVYIGVKRVSIYVLQNFLQGNSDDASSKKDPLPLAHVEDLTSEVHHPSIFSYSIPPEWIEFYSACRMEK
jgi:hypothetical protein